MSYDKVRAFLETYRVWDQADTELETELREVLDNAEVGDREAEVIETLATTHVPEPMQDKDHLNSLERLLIHYDQLAKRLKDEHQVEIFTPEGVTALMELLAARDGLGVFRARVLGVVKKAGALDMKAFPEDNHLVILLENLMP